MGLVKNIYKNYSNDIPVRSIIGHNRYSTAGKNSNNYGKSGEFVKGSLNFNLFMILHLIFQWFIMEIYKAYRMKQTILNIYLIILLKK